MSKEKIIIHKQNGEVDRRLLVSGVALAVVTLISTAFVSGVAALLKAQFPEITAAQMKKVIIESAKKEFSFTNKCKSEGRVDAAKAQEVAAKLLNHGNDTKVAKNEKKRDLANSKSTGKIIYRLNR